MTDNELRTRYPWVKWDKPFLVSLGPDKSGFACRYCIARDGLKAGEFVGLSYDEVQTHISTQHSVE